MGFNIYLKCKITEKIFNSSVVLSNNKGKENGHISLFSLFFLVTHNGGHVLSDIDICVCFNLREKSTRSAVSLFVYATSIRAWGIQMDFSSLLFLFFLLIALLGCICWIQKDQYRSALDRVLWYCDQILPFVTRSCVQHRILATLWTPTHFVFFYKTPNRHYSAHLLN